MIPSVSQGWGNQLYLIRGGQIDIVNRTMIIAELNETTPIGQADRNCGAAADFNSCLFGGHNSYYPGAYANHKPAAFLGTNRLITCPNYVKDAERHVWVTGFDGSGIFNSGGGVFETDPWKQGRGSEILSPSGKHGTETHDLALLRYNDHVFMIGAHVAANAAASNLWITKFGWTFGDNSDLTASELQRTYRVMSINETNGKKIAGDAINFLPNALNQNHLHSCDLIAFKDSLYYANWVDVLKFPGGSGTPQILHSDINNPRARSFEIWPSGGVSSDTSQGEIRLLMLNSDANLYRVKTSASGTDLLVDLDSLRTQDSSRDNDNMFARGESTTLEPGRTPFLKNFNSELHAFTTTETSGYMHFTCAGNPSGTTNWTDRTNEMPEDIRRVDGCLYGIVDDRRNKMFLLHVGYSKFGIFGHAGGGQNCGGGMWLYQHDADRTWTEIWRGNIGLPPRGLIPYQNLGPYASIPSGTNPQVLKCSDYTLITYKLFDQQARNIDVEVEYSTDIGVTWNTAKRFKSYVNGTPLGSGVTGLPTSPTGVEYTFFWDYVNDIGFNVQGEALLRIRPKVSR
jgi:hypothetical protein